MGRKKWSVTRFENHAGRSYGPRAKYRFETRVVARIVYAMCRIEALWTGHRPWLSYIPKYYIETEIGIDFADAGPWRSYHLDACGDSFQELVDSATVSEIDQDGGELDCYELRQASSEIETAVLRLILNKVA
jgi:hypothetical protein